MSRLTPFARILIVLAIVAGIFFGVKYLFPGVIGGSTDTVTTSETTTPTTEPTTTDTNNNGGTTTSTPSFNYTAPEPVNGKLRGVVELGATGFNSFIIRADAQKNWKLEKADYGSSLLYESMTNDADITAGLNAPPPSSKVTKWSAQVVSLPAASTPARSLCQPAGR